MHKDCTGNHGVAKECQKIKALHKGRTGNQGVAKDCTGDQRVVHELHRKHIAEQFKPITRVYAHR